MNFYNTGNPVPSNDPRDLDDNAKNLDLALNSDDPSFVDRKGVLRKTINGYGDSFSEFLIASGYEFLGSYDTNVPITITRPNQVFTKGGEYWRSGPLLNLPYTTVNNWVTDAPKFVSVGDAVLRQQLANTANPLSGVSLLGRAGIIFNSVAEMRLTDGRFSGDRATTLGYIAGDRKARGRTLTWTAGIGTDDGGMVFNTPTGKWISDLDADGEVSTEFWGLPYAPGVVSFSVEEKIEAFCFANKISVKYGPGPIGYGEYNYGTNNWPWSGARVAGSALKDYQGVRIKSGRRVTFKTVSVVGADVMQCCGIKNFGVLGFPTVTATLNNSGSDPGVGFSGSNAVSLVFGAVDCEFEINPTDMPGIYRTTGAIDGGQGWSIQPGTGNTNPYSNVRFAGLARNCTQGFACDFELDDQVLRPISGIVLDNLRIEDCYRGVAISGAAPTVAHSTKAYTGVSGDVTIKNCQQSYLNFRSVGTRINVEVVNTKDVAALIKNPYNSSVITTSILAAKDGYLNIRGRVLSTDIHLQVGAAQMGGIDVPTMENFELIHDVSYVTASTSALSVVEYASVALDKCIVSLHGLFSGYDPILLVGSNTLFVDGGICSHAINAGDASVTCKRVGFFEVLFAAPVTAARSVMFNSGAVHGDKVRVSRFATATGSSGVSLGGLINLLPGQYAEAMYIGGSWLVTKTATAI